MASKTIKRNEHFICKNCNHSVAPANKTCRNHCPECLWSLHVDGDVPGDRSSECQGLMEPIKITKNQKGYVIIHCCTKCRAQKPNRASEDDNWDQLVELSAF